MMNKMCDLSLSAFIDKVIIDILSDQVLEAIRLRQKKITVLFTGVECQQFYEVISQLTALQKKGFTISVVFSYSGCAIFDKYSEIFTSLFPANLLFTSKLHDEVSILKHVSDSHTLILPSLSNNSIAKVVLGISDSIPSMVIKNALVKQNKIIATANNVNKQDKTISPYLAQLNEYIEKLKTFGICFVQLSDLDPTIDNLCNDFNQSQENHFHGHLNKLTGKEKQSNFHRNHLLSLKDVLIHDEQKPIYINDNAIITPLAMDEIKRKKIQLINRS